LHSHITLCVYGLFLKGRAEKGRPVKASCAGNRSSQPNPRNRVASNLRIRLQVTSAERCYLPRFDLVTIQTR
jgi:hypothetical protein